MSGAPHFFRFHLGDYARDCEELSMLQHGAYLGLMRWYYSTARPLPNDLERIYRRVGAFSTEERNAVMYVLENFFRLDGNVWRHKRIDAELEQWHGRSGVAKQSAESRWKKSQEINESTDANALPTQCERNANQNQNHINNHLKSNKGGAGGKRKPDGAVAPVALPPWLDQQAWSEFEQHRKAIRKPMTDLARRKSWQTLDGLRIAGHDPTAVITQSIASGWTGLFPLKEVSSGARATKQDARADFWRQMQGGEPIDATAERVD